MINVTDQATQTLAYENPLRY